ncbi:MAG: hypothetical protein OXC62_04765 [Aestuariivita sp.]|nr:hypothetical protein [Aestuariivita sp.]
MVSVAVEIRYSLQASLQVPAVPQVSLGHRQMEAQGKTRHLRAAATLPPPPPPPPPASLPRRATSR